MFRKREPPASGPGAELPRAAVCFLSHAMTRRAADWLGNLGGCRPLGILSDDCDDVVWQCTAEKADLHRQHQTAHGRRGRGYPQRHGLESDL